MAQLIQMRQRIKAIETIKKITHAMRLISMSMHSRLRAKAPILQAYQNEVTTMFQKVKLAAPHWKNETMFPQSDFNSNPLVVLVASQKGLCGNFNSVLFRAFQEWYPEEKIKNITFVAVGKYAIDLLAKEPAANVIKSFDQFSSARLSEISSRLVDLIANTEKPYSSVVFVANGLKSFFVQKPMETTVLPLSMELDESTLEQMPKEPYNWEQNPSDVLDDLALQYLTSKVHHLLFQSLLAEQAARFISMDNSTRNAKTLLEETQLLYNKLRQAQITRELTELSASF